VPNLYGVANPNPLPIGANTIGGVDVNIVAGVETNFINITVPPAVSKGIYYPFAFVCVSFVCGGTPPSFINWGLRVNNGADVSAQNTRNQILVANANLVLPLFLFGYGTLITDPFGTYNFQVSANCGGQNFTVSNVGTAAVLGWQRAPDQ